MGPQFCSPSAVWTCVISYSTIIKAYKNDEKGK